MSGRERLTAEEARQIRAAYMRGMDPDRVFPPYNGPRTQFEMEEGHPDFLLGERIGYAIRSFAIFLWQFALFGWSTVKFVCKHFLALTSTFFLVTTGHVIWFIFFNP